MNEILSISQGIFPFLIIIFSIILHEVAHGYAAYIQGDETANRAGRLTLNPLSHIDPMGSILIPFLSFHFAGTFFGWAKPVPYNPHNIRSSAGQAFVASAGVLTNLLIAIVAGVVFKVLSLQGILSESLSSALFTIIGVNISLAFFNLIPIPPFDGMSIIQALFPRTHIGSRVVYNPLYMVGAILVATVLYNIFIPHIFSFVESILL
jgi:Zn-dependent protease